MRSLYSFNYFFVRKFPEFRILQLVCIGSLPCGMALRLEQNIKIVKLLNYCRGFHFNKAKRNKLLPCLVQKPRVRLFFSNENFRDFSLNIIRALFYFSQQFENLFSVRIEP